MITTASFSNGVKEVAFRADLGMVPIDGDEFAPLMVKHGLGVSVVERSS